MSYQSNTRPKRYSVYSSNSRRPRTNRVKSKYGQYIDPIKFVKRATGAETEDYVPKHTFADFDVHEQIHKNLSAKGYEIPSPIQDQAIPFALEGRDVIGLADTGTGKTAAFAIPLIDKLLKDPNSKALIVAPTRELAQQIEDECRSIGKSTGLFAVLLIGGTPMGPQLRDLRTNPRVVIGTPGRIKDHLERGTLQLSKFNTVVLDEVDRMLDMGFINDMQFILDSLSPERQSFFFSATLNPSVKTLIQKFSKNAETVAVKQGDTSENVHQDVVQYRSGIDKMDKLHDILVRDDVSKIIIFEETQRSVEKLSNELLSRGFAADAIHGGKNQSQRQRALNRFKKDDIKVLVATDVAARGIDVKDISHVINFSLPQTYEDYTHRIGRAGRAGKIGYALTFVTF